MNLKSSSLRSNFFSLMAKENLSEGGCLTQPEASRCSICLNLPAEFAQFVGFRPRPKKAIVWNDNMPQVHTVCQLGPKQSELTPRISKHSHSLSVSYGFENSF